MKKILLLCISFLSLPSLLSISAQDERIYDDANLLSGEEEVLLETRVDDLQNEYDIDIVILTVQGLDGKTIEAYADDYYDYNGFREDGILAMVDMDSREIHITTSGKMIRYFTDARIESTLDTMFTGAKEGSFEQSFSGFLDQVKKNMKAGIPSNQHTKAELRFVNNEQRATWVLRRLPVVAISSLGIAWLYTFIQSRRGRKFKMFKPKRKMSIKETEFTKKEDTFLDTNTTTVVLKNTSSSSSGRRSGSGRSTTHRSSSGRSHGGGSRKF